MLNYKSLSILLLLSALGLYCIFRIPSEKKVNEWKVANPENALKIELHCTLPHPISTDETE